MGETRITNLEKFFLLMWIKSILILPVGVERRKMHDLIKPGAWGIMASLDLVSPHCEESSQY